MKGFYITLALFSALIICGILNFLFVNNVHNEMNEMVAEISRAPCAENEERIQNLSDYWEKTNTKLSFSVSYTAIDTVTNLIDSIKLYNDVGDSKQLAYSIELLINAIDNIKRLENFSVKNIF